MIYYKGRQIDEINAYNVEGTTLNNQSKEIEINKNGETIITYDEGYTGLEQVTVNVNVTSQGGEGGNSFSVIGYTEVPQYIQDGIDYSKEIYDNWDASITNRSNAFKGDTQLIYFPLVDTSNVTDMIYMFAYCSNLQYVPNIVVSNNVTNMNSMFYNCYNLTSLDLSNFDTSNVTIMTEMFYNCRNLTSLDVSSFDTSNVKYMTNIFYNCSGLTSLDVSNWNTSAVTNMNYMFANCSGLTSINFGNTFDTSKVTTMSGMFNGCSGLTSLDLSNFNTSKVNGMGWMFAYCSDLTSLDISNWDTSNVTDMSYMLYGCTKLQRIDGCFDWSKIRTVPTNFIYYHSTMIIRYFTIKNIGTAGNLFNFNNNSLENWGDETDIETYPLSVGARQSLVDSLLTYSYDRAANGLSNATIQLHSNVKARLTEDEITAIQNKGYTIS